MKVSTWLVIELRRDDWSKVVPVIVKARRTRPVNEMAVKVTLDIDPADLQPHVDALVEAGHITLEIDEAVEGEK